MAKYSKEGKVVEVGGVRFNVNYLKTTKKRKVLEDLKSHDKSIVEEAFDEVNKVKKTSSNKPKDPTKKDSKKKSETDTEKKG